MNEGTYPRNLSRPWSVVGVMLALTSMCWFAVNSGTVLEYLNV